MRSVYAANRREYGDCGDLKEGLESGIGKMERNQKRGFVEFVKKSYR